MTEKTKLIKPAWNETLSFLLGMFEEDKRLELLEELAKKYFESKSPYHESNPYTDDLYFVGDLMRKNGYVKIQIIDADNAIISIQSDSPVIKNIGGEWFKRIISGCLHPDSLYAARIQDRPLDDRPISSLRKILDEVKPYIPDYIVFKWD